MSKLAAFVQKVETGATHIVTVIETDVATMEHRIVAAMHVLGGDLAAFWQKAQDDAVAEVKMIEDGAIAAKQKVAAKLAAIKSALGV